jgi:ribosome maturation factor RimP
MSIFTSLTKEQELEIVEIELKASKSPTLTVYIDKEGGVELNACERFHRAIDPVLDERDPTFGTPYTLNVSSPGLDRPLKKPRDFEKRMGQKVEVKLFAPLKGKKLFEAKLVGYDGNCVELEDNCEVFKLELSKIAKICLAIDFDGLF